MPSDFQAFQFYKGHYGSNEVRLLVVGVLVGDLEKAVLLFTDL